MPSLGLGLSTTRGTTPGASLPFVETVAFMGDSITGGVNVDISVSTQTIAGYAIGPLFHDSGLELVTSSAGGNFQTGGYSAAEIRDTWLPQVITAEPDLCCWMAGTNSLGNAVTAGGGDNVVAAAWLFGQLVEIMEGLRDAGIASVVGTITPDTTPSVTADMRTIRALTNDLIRAHARSYGTVVCDWAPLISTDPGDDTALANDLYLRDYVHLNTVGYWRIGSALLDTIKANFEIPEFAIPDVLDPSWVSPNPYLAGDVSGLATNATVTLFGTPNAVVTPSKTADGWQRLVIAGALPLNNISATYQIRTPQVTNDAYDGKLYQAIWDVRPVEVGWNFWAIRPRLTCSTFDGGTSRQGNCVATYSSTSLTTEEKTIMDWKPRLTFRTPIVQHPGGTGVQRREHNCSLAFWGSGTVDIRVKGVVEIL
jgi:lysophospholipase L1-like esterase